MPTKVSYAEKGGMPFEKRCEEVLGYLRELWELFQKISNVDLQFRQERMKNREEFLASLSESVREQATPLLEELVRGRTEVDEKFYKTMWEDVLDFTREVFGADAVEFALRALDVERRKN